MNSKVIMGIVLTLLFVVMLTLTLNIQPVEASGTIRIKADGSVDPDTAPISSVDNITYTFTDHIANFSIIVERDNIVLDGAGYTLLDAAGLTYGIDLTGRRNVTIKNIEIRGFWCGIYLYESSNNTISGNNVTDNDVFCIMLADYSAVNTISGNIITTSQNASIYLYMASNNTISGNIIANSSQGVFLDGSDVNTISGNNITNNMVGVSFMYHESSDNEFYHNNFINNTFQHVSFYPSSYANVWDDGYPSGGNYWSNYTGVDDKKGPNQDQPGSDGIGDTQHVIDVNNIDRYPLMNPQNRTETIIEVRGVHYPLMIDSNTTIGQINFTETPDYCFLRFSSSGPTGERAYILLIVPKIFPEQEILVSIDGQRITPVINNNGTHYFIYFEFTLSTHNITVRFRLFPVGGIWIPVDKLVLLAPYIGLVSTIILTIAVAAVFFRYRKKQ